MPTEVDLWDLPKPNLVEVLPNFSVNLFWSSSWFASLFRFYGSTAKSRSPLRVLLLGELANVYFLVFHVVFSCYCTLSVNGLSCLVVSLRVLNLSCGLYSLLFGSPITLERRYSRGPWLERSCVPETTEVSRSYRGGIGLHPGPFYAPISLYISSIVFLGYGFSFSFLSLSSYAYLALNCSKL